MSEKNEEIAKQDLMAFIKYYEENVKPLEESLLENEFKKTIRRFSKIAKSLNIDDYIFDDSISKNERKLFLRVYTNILLACGCLCEKLSKKLENGNGGRQSGKNHKENLQRLKNQVKELYKRDNNLTVAKAQVYFEDKKVACYNSIRGKTTKIKTIEQALNECKNTSV
ncbi:MAG: hypothetical protein IKN71_04120 [Alphaproteobacteria bacterium]|nr:hypothetical protein [Alphaproteobacteria bacterium]